MIEFVVWARLESGQGISEKHTNKHTKTGQRLVMK